MKNAEFSMEKYKVGLVGQVGQNMTYTTYRTNKTGGYSEDTQAHTDEHRPTLT